MFGGGAIDDAIMRLLGRGEAGLGNTPGIDQATAAYRAQVERNGRRTRNAMAERYAAEGLNPGGAGSGAFDSAIQSQQESEGIAVANKQAEMNMQELMAQRQDVIAAITLAQGQERIALTQYLAQLNNEIQRMGLNQQNSQFYDDFSYRMGRDQIGDDRWLLDYLAR